MSLKNTWIDFGPEKAYRGYLSQPSSGAAPGLILIQEVWGVDGHIQDVARRFATAGYAVLAPDLYSQAGKHPEGMEEERVAEAKQFLNSQPAFFMMAQPEKAAALGSLDPAAAARINDTMEKLFSGIVPSRPKHLEILGQAAAWLKDRPEAPGQKLGALGFCMGGGLAGLLACEGLGLAASVIFYGQGIPKEKMGQCECRVLAFYGEKDSRLLQPLPEFEHEMQEAGQDLEAHVYLGAGHAFFNDTRPSFNAAAAADSFTRSLAFLKERLS